MRGPVALIGRLGQHNNATGDTGSTGRACVQRARAHAGGESRELSRESFVSLKREKRKPLAGARAQKAMAGAVGVCARNVSPSVVEAILPLECCSGAGSPLFRAGAETLLREGEERIRRAAAEGLVMARVWWWWLLMGGSR